SVNTTWAWGDQSDDANTIFHDPTTPNRTAQWRPDATKDENNRARGLPLTNSSNILEWTDKGFAIGAPEVTRMIVALPMGLVGGVGTVSIVVQQRADIHMRFRTRGARGELQDVAEYHDVDEAAISPDSVTIPTGESTSIKEVILEAVRAIVTGSPDATSDAVFTSSFIAQTKFVVGEETEFEEIHLRLKKGVSTETFTWSVKIRDDSGATPLLGRIVVDLDSGTFSAGDITSSYVRYAFATAAGRFTLQPGTYWLEVNITWTDGTFSIRTGDPKTKHNITYGSLGYADSPQPMWFAAIHALAESGPVEPEAERFNASALAHFDDVKIKLDSAKTPFVDRFGDFTNGLYHCVGQIKNVTTGGTIDIDLWMATGSTLTINTDDRTVEYAEGNHKISIPAAIILSTSVSQMSRQSRQAMIGSMLGAESKVVHITRRRHIWH
ncbi:hypothetical protein LCGC14_2527240, partial [marine sediment metagenome]